MYYDVAKLHIIIIVLYKNIRRFNARKTSKCKGICEYSALTTTTWTKTTNSYNIYKWFTSDLHTGNVSCNLQSNIRSKKELQTDMHLVHNKLVRPRVCWWGRKCAGWRPNSWMSRACRRSPGSRRTPGRWPCAIGFCARRIVRGLLWELFLRPTLAR